MVENINSLGSFVSAVGFPSAIALIILYVAGKYAKTAINGLIDELKAAREDNKHAQEEFRDKLLTYMETSEQRSNDQVNTFTDKLIDIQDKYDNQFKDMSDQLSRITLEYNDKLTKVADVLKENTEAINKLREEMENREKYNKQ